MAGVLIVKANRWDDFRTSFKGGTDRIANSLVMRCEQERTIKNVT